MMRETFKYQAKHNIHYSCEIEDFVETHLRKLRWAALYCTINHNLKMQHTIAVVHATRVSYNYLHRRRTAKTQPPVYNSSRVTAARVAWCILTSEL